MWIGTATSGRLLWTLQRIFGFYETLWNLWVADILQKMDSAPWSYSVSYLIMFPDVHIPSLRHIVQKVNRVFSVSIFTSCVQQVFWIPWVALVVSYVSSLSLGVRTEISSISSHISFIAVYIVHCVYILHLILVLWLHFSPRCCLVRSLVLSWWSWIFLILSWSGF